MNNGELVSALTARALHNGCGDTAHAFALGVMEVRYRVALDILAAVADRRPGARDAATRHLAELREETFKPMPTGRLRA